MRCHRALLVFAVGLLCCAAAIAQSPFAPKVSGPLSQRVVAYQIDAKYDPAKHTVDATETLTYHNLTGQPLDRFPFHLYLNAFQPKSTWMHEAHRDGNFRTSSLDKWKPEDYGSNEVTSFEVVGMGDLTKQMKFISPDDGNPDDKTVFEVKLPRPVAPGQDVQFKIKFKATFPEVIARTGYKRTFLLAGQWFPKVGVWWHGAWNCHQFHAMTEFFADFGTYDVKITLPKNYVIGATGVQSRRHRQRQWHQDRRLPRRRCSRLRLDRRSQLQGRRRPVRRQRRPGEDSPAQLRQPQEFVAALHHCVKGQHEAL